MVSFGGEDWAWYLAGGKRTRGIFSPNYVLQNEKKGTLLVTTNRFLVFHHTDVRTQQDCFLVIFFLSTHHAGYHAS